MNAILFTLLASACVLYVIIHKLLIEYFAERTINVRKHLPDWTKQLKHNFDINTTNSESIQFKTSDNLKIDYLFIHAEANHKGNIIFIHGIRANKYYFIEQAIFMSKKGYNCILPDLRGHGESDGLYCTFGYLEKTDISLLLDNLASNFKITNNFGIWGHSLGASIAIQTLELDKRIGFMILEAPFSDLKKILEEYFRRKLWLFGELYFHPTIKKIEKKLGFPIHKVNPANSAKNIKQPSILLHGTNDTKILKYHSNLIFNNLPTNNKIIYEIKNADHNNIKDVWKNEYYKNTLRFIDNSVKQIQFTN